MKAAVPFRVVVKSPPAGVAMKIQRGKSELLEPVSSSDSELIFDFEIDVDTASDPPNFLGKFAQGPKDARFVYVNSGTYAGQAGSPWGRRAKLSLIPIASEQVQKALSDAALCFEAVMRGTGTDGGPTCASVKGLEWNLAKK